MAKKMEENRQEIYSQTKEPLAPEDRETGAGEEVIKLSKADFEKVKAHIESVQKEKDEALTASKKQKKGYEKAKQRIAELESEKDEAIAIAQRLHADFDNYRKRNATLRTDSFDEGKRDCIKALLPVLDSFDRAMENAQGVEPGFLEGIGLVQRLLLDTLGKQGLEEIPAAGLFDPKLHDAVMQEAVNGKESGEILEVLQKGYCVRDRILRHSMVKVAE